VEAGSPRDGAESRAMKRLFKGADYAFGGVAALGMRRRHLEVDFLAA
jgi:hypothetical protein